MRLEGVSVARVLRAWESHAHGEGPQLIGSLVATLLDVHAWESRQMPAERERGGKSNRRRPYAVKAARTVTTGGWRDGSNDTALCPYPLGARQAAKKPGLAQDAYGE